MIERTVTEADGGIRLDRWFKRHFPTITHGLLEKSLRKGLVRLDGKKAAASDRVAAGQMLRVPGEWANEKPEEKPEYTPRWKASEDDIKNVQRMVLYKDEDVLVINKPPGLAVQGGTGQGKHLDAMLGALRFDAADRPRLVHRLDKDTSGCLCLARSAKAAAQLAKMFKERETEKIYRALVIGLPLPLEGTVDLPLSKSERGKDSRMEAYEKVSVDEESGQTAITEYKVLEHCADKLSWVEMKPITGRTHQLRVHMAAIGHPIVGDGKYGGRDAFVRGSLEVSQQLHLHADRIIIPHMPGRKIDVRAPLPNHIKESLKTFNIDGS